MIEIFKIGEINSTKKTDSEKHFDCDPNFCFNHCSRD